MQAAKGLAFALDKPVVGVDHLVGHLLAVFLKFPGAPEQAPAEYPFVALLASGGHTALYRVDGPQLSQVHELGATRIDFIQQFVREVSVLGRQIVGHPIAVEHEIAGACRGEIACRRMVARSRMTA